MPLYLELAIDIQRRPRHEWDTLLAALPDDVRGPVAAWLGVNPTYNAAAMRRARSGRRVDSKR